ncbi:hypothetical protein EV175_001390, partial [Coemansia sp. RSA 1933]
MVYIPAAAAATVPGYIHSGTRTFAIRAITKDDVTHSLTPTQDQKYILIAICAYAVGILVLWNIPYVNIILLPFKLVTVALHEFSHAAAGLCTGARIQSITIDPDEGGKTIMSGGKWCCVMPAGYLGSSLLGAVMVFAGFNVLASKIVSAVIGVCLLATLYWAKNWLTRVITVLFVGLIIGLWFTPHGIGLRYVVLFMGVMSSLYCLWDIVDDTIRRKVNESDATKFAKKTHCSSRLCGISWLFLSLVFLVAAILLGAQALLLNPTSESQICSQVLRAACVTDNGHSPVDSDAFGKSVLQWIEYCEETIRNSPDYVAHQRNDVDVRLRLASAFAEAIWALGVEWELDTTVESDDRWTSEQLRYTEQRGILVELAKGLITRGVVDQELAKERLDPDILEQIGTIPSAAAFTRKIIRLNTALHYKQTKFNLISEQSEGFSKLVALIQSSMAGVAPNQLSADILTFINDGTRADSPRLDAHDTAVKRALRSLPGLQSRVSCLLVDIQRLIGVFNIDPNRVVDIILDCFTSNVRHYWGFYIALLDASPWCKGLAESKKVAQLVGWKLQFYIKGPASDYRYTDELSTVAALLIAHGLIRLVDIYPMLEPEDGHSIQKEFDDWRAKTKEQSSNSGRSLLAMVGGLEDTGEGGESNTMPGSGGGNVESEWRNQHALLCTKLLSVGGISDALAYLKRYPSMARVHEQIADLAVRIIDVSTEELYRATNCVKAQMEPRIRNAKPAS